MTADEKRDQLVQEMLPVATGLVESVHDLDLPATWKTLNELREAGDWDRAAAVIVALAAMVRPGARTQDLLAWCAAEKRCPGCKRMRPMRAFGQDRHRGDGHTVRCRDCINASDRRRGWAGRLGCGRQEVAA